jgi:hypothetical protein
MDYAINNKTHKIVKAYSLSVSGDPVALNARIAQINTDCGYTAINIVSKGSGIIVISYPKTKVLTAVRTISDTTPVINPEKQTVPEPETPPTAMLEVGWSRMIIAGPQDDQFVIIMNNVDFEKQYTVLTR